MSGAGGLAHRVGQCLEIVTAAGSGGLGVVALVPHDLPTPWGRQPLCVVLAQVVAVRFGLHGERPHDGGTIGVDIGERGDGRTGAGGTGATPDRAHGPDGSRPGCFRPATRRACPPQGRRSPTLRAVDTARMTRRRRRDRHGRGLRGPLVPPVVSIGGKDIRVPASQTRGQRFDDLVLDAVEDLEQRWGQELQGVEFAVEDVPAVPLRSDVALDEDVLADQKSGGAVPLGRLLPTGLDGQGHETAPRIVVYRRPLEARAADRLDLADLVREVVVEQVARLLNLDPDDIDPPAA